MGVGGQTRRTPDLFGLHTGYTHPPELPLAEVRASLRMAPAEFQPQHTGCELDCKHRGLAQITAVRVPY